MGNSRRFIVFLLGMMLLIQVINTFTHNYLLHFGILPRELWGVPGILFAPLLHFGWGHLLSNFLPLAVLLVLIAQYGTNLLLSVVIGITLLTGGLVWSFGGPGVHVGASGLLLGCWGFLLARAFFYPSGRSIVIALLVFVFYGGMFWSLVDFRPHISWSSHLFGFFSGVVMARLLTRRSEAAEA